MNIKLPQSIETYLSPGFQKTDCRAGITINNNLEDKEEMITSNLLIKLKERDNKNAEKVKAVLLGMKGKINVLRGLQVEIDIRRRESSYDILLITCFSSMEDMEAYLVHPVHVEVSKYIAEVLESGASVCYESY